MLLLYFVPLNGIFDTELVHLSLSGSVQMSIKYHYDPEILCLTFGGANITGHTAPLGA